MKLRKKRDRRRKKTQPFLEDEPLMSYKDIGKKLKIPTATVCWVCKKALQKMRERMAHLQ